MTSTSTEYVGVCISIRQTAEGEALWQSIMGNYGWISEADFLSKCDLTPVLDPDETSEQWLACLQPELFGCATVGGRTYYFVQGCGFEYIWRAKTRVEKYEIAY